MLGSIIYAGFYYCYYSVVTYVEKAPNSKTLVITSCALVSRCCFDTDIPTAARCNYRLHETARQARRCRQTRMDSKVSVSLCCSTSTLRASSPGTGVGTLTSSTSPREEYAVRQKSQNTIYEQHSPQLGTHRNCNIRVDVLRNH